MFDRRQMFEYTVLYEYLSCITQFQHINCGYWMNGNFTANFMSDTLFDDLWEVVLHRTKRTLHNIIAAEKINHQT